jgi:hypothetical protein
MAVELLGVTASLNAIGEPSSKSALRRRLPGVGEPVMDRVLCSGGGRVVVKGKVVKTSSRGLDIKLFKAQVEKRDEGYHRGSQAW